jgi:hypothetical protein
VRDQLRFSLGELMQALSIARRDAPAAAPLHDGPHGFDRALHLMEEGRWRAAFECLSELADGGHPQAARIALLFVTRGTSLFGGTFHADATRRERWCGIATLSGCDS